MFQLRTILAFLPDLSNKPDICEIYFFISPEIVQMNDNRDTKRSKCDEENRVCEKHGSKVKKNPG